MKILIATESYYPNISGVAVFAHNLARKMVASGHEVFVIAPSPKMIAYEEKVDGIKIFRLASKTNPWRKGYYISRWPFRRVGQIIQAVMPDIIHLQDPALISLASLRKARKMKIPVVVTNHFSLEYTISYLPSLKIIHPLFLKVLRTYLGWFYNRADLLTCPTKTVAANFLKANLKTRVEVISNGVDLSRFMPFYGDTLYVRRKFKIPENLPLVLFVGRLDVDKDLKTLIKAIPYVLKEVEAHFVIVGEGKIKTTLEQMVKKSQVSKNVTFIGFIPHDNEILPRIYQMSQVFINPCPSETQSIVVLEAQATGLPVVLANAGALPELVKDGVNGFLFKPSDELDLAKKINQILENTGKAQKMGESSLEKLESHLVDTTHNLFEKNYLRLTKK
ncbi:MAG: glycosyltransferase [Patescibacteria group bacterium]|nr:glycosyltransferase [Patescibacteria group bacterium]